MRLIFGTAFFAVCCLTAITAQDTKPTPGANGQPATGGKNNQAPQFDAARFFKDHDKNNDGKLSKDELPQGMQSQFDKLDTNKDGFISKEELTAHAEKMAHEMPQAIEVVWYLIDIPENETESLHDLQQTYDLLRKIDTNHDGKIEASEMKAHREERVKERIDSIFAHLDTNHDGKISKEEARGVWADNFATLDKNKDGFLDRQEVMAACGCDHSGSKSPTGTTGRGTTPQANKQK